MNEIFGRMANKEQDIIVGAPATILYYSDRTPATVISVSKTKKTIKLQEDTAKRIDKNGMSDAQEYEYTRNLNGIIHTARLRKNGKYYTPGEAGCIVLIGIRQKYFDFSF